jgi:hypothetical protein
MERPRPLPTRSEDHASEAGTKAADGAVVAFPYSVGLAIEGSDGTRTPTDLPLHGDLRVLSDHVARHLLEPSARAALVAAHPWLREIDVFASTAAAERYLSHHAHDPSFEAVARAYTRLVQAALDEAAVLGWSVQVDRKTSVHLDSAGMLVLIGSGIVRTAFIPGVDHVHVDIEMRHESRNERIAREARERRWSGDERYFYRVFRPALRTIRRFPTTGVRGDAQYGALKRVLPALADLRIGAWQALRTRLGHARMSGG